MKIKILVALVCVLAIAGTVFASFSDVSEDHEYYDAISYVEEEGIVSGYADGTYLPDQLVNRAELTKIIVNSVYDEDTIEACELDDDVFPDFDHGEWFTKYVCVAYGEGIIGGYLDGTFQPANTIIFVEAAKIIVNGFGYEVEEGDVWYEPYVEVLEEYDAVPDAIGDDMEHQMTRGEVAEIIYVLLAEEDEVPSMLTHVDTINIVPDDNYDFGAFCRMNYVEATDNFVVTFGGSNQGHPDEAELDESNAGGLEGAGGYVYKIYSTDLEYTGENGQYIYGGGDAATVMVDDVYYHLTGGPAGWKLAVYDAVTWEQLDEIEIELDDDEQANDQMIAYVNGEFVLSSILSSVDQTETDPEVGYATHNHVLDSDLGLVDEFDLDDVEHINGSSLVFVDEVYHFVTSTAYFGDLIVMQYDEDWNFLESKTLYENAQWPQGTVYDEERELFYVAYLENVQGSMGRDSNTKLGVFDKNWETVEVIDVTNYSDENYMMAGRPSVMMHDEKLYVSYDVSSSEGFDWECWVSVYEF